jgi:hypothetical protein
MAGENRFEHHIIKKLRLAYPGAVIIKNYGNYLQGFPDRLILYGPHWAAFEVKADYSSSHRPNQDFYIQKLNRMSYASFIYPQNELEVLHAIQQTLRPGR